MEIEMNIAKNTNANTTFDTDSYLSLDGLDDLNTEGLDPHYSRLITLFKHVDADIDDEEWKKVIELLCEETDGSDFGFCLAIVWSGQSVFGRDDGFIDATWGYENGPH